MPMQEGKAGAGKQTYKSFRWHYTLMTKMVNMREEHYGLPRPHHGARHKAIRHANAVAANITQAITAAEAAIVPRAALTAAEQKIVQLKEKVKEARDAGKKDFKVAQDVANKAVSAMNSAKELLDTANARLAEHKLETVMPKVAPTVDGTAGTEGAFSQAEMHHVSIDTQLQSFDSEENQGEQKEDS
jgi:hypothetical protein